MPRAARLVAAAGLRRPAEQHVSRGLLPSPSLLYVLRLQTVLSLMYIQVSDKILSFAASDRSSVTS